MRQLAAWEGADGQFYLSAFIGERVHANGATPAKAFETREALEAHARTRKDGKGRSAGVIWEHYWPEPAQEPPADAP